MNRNLVAGLAAGFILAFAGGFGLARLTDGVGRPSEAAPSVPDGGAVWRLFGRPRSADAPRRGAVRPEGFVVWTSRLDTAGAQPLACVRMTRALDPTKSYGDFVLVSPDVDHPPAVSVRGDEICLGGLGFGEHRVTLLAGLPDKAGERLAANAEVPFVPADASPYVGFVGEGVILPREESDGVGIETINVSKVAVEVWRVSDRNLVRKSVSAPSPTGEGEYPDDYGDDSPDDEGRVVWKGQLAVPGDPGAKTTTVFPLGAVLKEMRPGGYVIKVRDISGGRDAAAKTGEEGRPAQARRWVMFTDMALTAYKGAEGLDVVVRSLKTARVAPGVPVALLARNGETLFTSRADASGRARFPANVLAGQDALTAKMVMAYGAAGDLAVLDLTRAPLDLSKQGVGGRDGVAAGADDTGGRVAASVVDGFLYSDRGVYRPGETVHLNALLRDLGARAVTDRKGYIDVKRPSGVELRRYPFAAAPGGAVTADIILPASAPRGHWTADLVIDGLDGAAGSLAFAVEDFVPQRLAVTASGHPETPVAGGETRIVDVTARFLYGATGAGLQTQGEARLRVDPNPFPQYPGYLWGDVVNPFAEKFVDLGASVTDGEGRARIALAANAAGDTHDPLSAAVTASVFEPGGRPVREGLTLKVRPLPMYLGVAVDQGAVSGDRTPLVGLGVIAVDGAGRRLAASVNWRLISETWNYDWFQQDGRWQWRRTSRDIVAAAGVLAVGTGQPARLSRRLGWGDYRLELEGPGGARTVRRFSAGWGAPADDAEAPDQVRLSAGARPHKQGDTIEVAIKAAYAGEAQIAVATDRLIDFKTLSLPAGGGVARLKTSAAWGGGAYVMVSVIQPRDPVKTPVPRRALGLVYVPLDPGGRRLTIDIGTPARLDSRQPVTVPLRVRGLGVGQSAYVTVAAVDEGILALTHFETPDPAKWYFGKRALGVDYRDDYGRILDANLGAPANVNFGGDELGGEGLTVTPTRTVALWSGVVRTGLDGRARVALPPGDFNGQLRVMAVAWTDRAVGSASTPLTVREPVVADLDLPRFLAPGDRPIATLEVHNLEGRAGDYTARTGPGQGDILALARQVFHLATGQRVALHIPFQAPVRTGTGQIGFQVTGPGFSTSKSYGIQTRLGWGAVTRATTTLQGPGEVFVPPPSLLAGLAAGDVSLQVSYSPFQGFDPAAVALSLSRYPYSCTEQLVSTGYPALYAASASADPSARVRLGETVGKLIDRQSLDGAFGLWRVGDGESDPWLGAYVVDFLLDARAQGAALPPDVLDRALSAMRKISRPDGFAAVSYRLAYPETWFGDKAAGKAATARLRSRASAYALYVMAKAGRGDLPRLRWQHDVQMNAERSPMAMAQVGAGLALMGDRARARDSLRRAAAALGYKDAQDDYQSPLRDLAGVIALAYEAGEPDLARALQGRLAGAVRDPDRLNTQEEAWLLRAARAMFAAAGPMHVEASGAAALPGAGSPRWAVGTLAQARFVNRGRGPLWRTVTVRGTPTRPPEASASGLEIAKTVYTLSGAPVDLASVRQGQRVIVRISGASRQGRTVSLMVNDALPAGFEIETLLGPDDGATSGRPGPFRFLGPLSTASVQESRDDRYVAAISLPGGKAFAFGYIARAVTPGAFFMPGAEAADMYHPAVAARSAAGRLTVTPAG